MARVLIVNDEPDLLELCQLTLCEAGHHAEILTSGRKAIERAGRGDLDLIVVDWVMPDMDGNAVLARLKGGSDTKNIPVLAMSALRDGKTRAQMAGADSFLAKPFSVDDLVDAVARTLTLSDDKRQTTSPQARRQ
jgi:two-component system response regulator ArlR